MRDDEAALTPLKFMYGDIGIIPLSMNGLMGILLLAAEIGV